MKLRWIPNRFFGISLPVLADETVTVTPTAATPPANEIVPDDKANKNKPVSKEGTNMVRIGTINIQDNPEIPEHLVKACAKAVANKFSVGGFQEIDKEDRKPVADGLGKNMQLVNSQYNTPLAYDLNAVTFLDRGHVFVHAGKAKTAPEKNITWIKCATKRDAIPFMVINNHCTTKKPTSKLPNPQWRTDQFDRHIRLLRDLIMSNPGILTFVVGDFNAERIELPGVKWVFGENTNDKIGVRQGKSTRAKFLNHMTIQLPTTDGHAAQFATFDIERN